MGAASLLFSRPPAPVEVLNDQDGNVVNLFRCLQDPARFDELKHRLRHTLYARAETERQVYAVELDHDHHVQLVETLLACQGAVVLSGYEHPVYAPLTDAGWTVTRYETACHAASRGRGTALRGAGAARQHVPRTEAVWANPRAVAACQERPPLFPRLSGRGC